MRLRRITAVAAVMLAVAACGGGDGGEDPVPAGSTQTDTGTQDNPVSGSGTSSDEVTPEASGDLAPNTIRIGDQVWERTLPMEQGQCFLYEDDGTLPTSATVWGTLDGDEDFRFSANYRQDGTFASEVTDYSRIYWASGSEAGEPDLVIELDFETLTITGHGTYRSLTSQERAEGSFTFTCEPDQG